jgi:Cd2+/Zn2+-exporting ATPase/Cu+-exporting ATPase
MQDGSEAKAPERSIRLSEWVRIALIALGALATWLGLWKPLGRVDLLAIAIALAGGWPILREAFSAVLARRMTMELSMTIAIAAAFAIGESFTGLVIILFVLVAEVLERHTVSRGRSAIANLLELLPRQATVVQGGETVELPISRLSLGDVVLVRPGAWLPIDGKVVSGYSFVDQSTVTGESVPVEKVQGGRVYAGTINQSGTLQVETTGIGPDTAFGKIIRAVEEAEKSRAPIQRTADRLAGFLVYFAIAAAVVTFLATRDVRSTIAVVIVAGACGVAAGTPLAILGAIGRAARLGAIVKGGRHLEALGRVDTIVLDKTGTLTLGRPEVCEVVPCTGATAESIVRTAAIAERPSEHPVARSILDRAKLMRLDIPEAEAFQYSPGGGITCRAEGENIVVGSRSYLSERGLEVTDCPAPAEHFSEVWVARAGRVLGAIGIADVLRSEAHEAVQSFKRLGLKTVLLTGDSSAVAAAIGQQLGVDEVRAELLPEQKLAAVRVLAATGRRVAVVGDGINDAPALMAADVGIAMGSGTDIAQESAGILLLGDDLMVLVETVRLARRCRRIIMQNFYGTLLVDSLGILVASLGMLTPLWAAFIHVSSELAFILNSTRLLPRRRTAAAKDLENSSRAVLPTKLHPARLP